jgi:hypothetical protein
MQRPSPASPIAHTVDTLTAQARQAAEATPCPLNELIGSIKTTLASEADPYLLVGVLLEGIVQVLAKRVPTERKPATEVAAMLMLQQRLGATAAACGS